jgi:hypothetical protein
MKSHRNPIEIPLSPTKILNGYPKSSPILAAGRPQRRLPLVHLQGSIGLGTMKNAEFMGVPWWLIRIS